MKPVPYFRIFSVCSILLLQGCSKSSTETSSNLFDETYTTGVIKFNYKTPTTSGGSILKDTFVNFTAVDPAQQINYGFNQPSVPYAQVTRRYPTNNDNWTIFGFMNTDLNLLTLPYKFESANSKYTVINYVTGLQTVSPGGGTVREIYYASTRDSFQLTVLSKVNNRLQGTFNGKAVNQSGNKIDITNGLFDIMIVDK